MSSVIQKTSFPQKLTIDCKLENKGIKDFILNGSTIFQNGKLKAKYIYETDISEPKKELEAWLLQNSSDYSRFKIENINGRLLLKPSTFAARIFNKSHKLPLAEAEKIKHLCDRIENKKLANNIFSKTKAHNITQLEDVPKTNRKLTAMLLGLIVIGFLSGIISIGSLLTNYGVLSTHMGIVGIPLSMSWVLFSAGALTMLGLTALAIASKKSKIANEYLKDILKMKGELFLEGNGNDLTNGCLMLLLGLTSLHFGGKETLIGCLAFPTGALLMFSAAYQFIQSIRSLYNSRLTKDLEQQIRSVVGILFSISLFAYGVLTTIGMANTLPHIILMFCVGITALTLVGFGVKKSYENVKEIMAVDKTDPYSIIKYLQSKFDLNDEEIEKIKTSVFNMTSDDILKWIKTSKKGQNKETQKIWEEIYEKIQNKKRIEIEEIKKLILNEEIKTAIEKKLDSFRGLIKENTYKKAANALQKFKKDPKLNKKELTDLFGQIKSQILLKTAAEMVKFFLVFLPSMILPALKLGGLIKIQVYDFIMAGISFLLLTINATPRFRNVPPEALKKPLDINALLDAYGPLKEKASKTNKAALEKFATPQLAAS